MEIIDENLSHKFCIRLNQTSETCPIDGAQNMLIISATEGVRRPPPKKRCHGLVTKLQLKEFWEV